MKIYKIYCGEFTDSYFIIADSMEDALKIAKSNGLSFFSIEMVGIQKMKSDNEIIDGVFTLLR